MTPAKHSQNWLPGIFNDFFGNEWIAKSNSSAPAVNIIENDKEYEVEIAAPGHNFVKLWFYRKISIRMGLKLSRKMAY